jgi:two-component system, OmpR family, KDP operon response regulator KdpE
MNRAEILIIDDEPQIRKLLQINLESNDYKVIQASNAKEGLALASNHPPELIILDLGLPDFDGHYTLSELRKWYLKPIIVLSVLDREEDIIKALDNGASDYMTKPFRNGELLARIRSAIRNNQNKENLSGIYKTENFTIDIVNRIVVKNDTTLKLTSTEFNMLALFVKNEGKVLTHQFILREIWGFNYQSENQYLRVFIGTLRKKIEDNPNNPKHITTLNTIGYRFQF